MRAARLHEPGQPLRIEAVPLPELRPRDVLVEVKAAGIIPNMNAIFSGRLWNQLPRLPACVGLDTAGTVAGVGRDVTDVVIGERVYVNPWLSCGSCAYCRASEPLLCSAAAFQGYFGFSKQAIRQMEEYPFGAFSQYITAAPARLVRLPSSVTFEQAARFGYLGTSFAALRLAGVGGGSSIAINGMTGTLGVGATLLALAMGATRILGFGRRRPVRLIVPSGPGLGTEYHGAIARRGPVPIARSTIIRRQSARCVRHSRRAGGCACRSGRVPRSCSRMPRRSRPTCSCSNRFLNDPVHDFTAVAMVSHRGPFVVSVNPELPVKSLPQLMAYAKSQPGKLAYGVDVSSGYGVVVGRLLNKRAGLGMVEVLFRATAQMLQETAAGTTQVMISAFGAVVGFANSGKLRRIAISSAHRFPSLEELPAIAETLPGFELDGWLVVVAPRGTPRDILAHLNGEIDRFLTISRCGSAC